MSSRRMSLGGRATPLRDASSYQNTRSSSVSRRMSFGGNGGSHRSETPIKDRRAMLEEYRRSKTRDHATAMSSDGESSSPHKRVRTNEPPRLPPSSSHAPAPASTFVAGGTGALERIRMRKLMKQQQKMDESNLSNNTSSICYDDDDETSTYSGGRARLPAATPSSGNRNRRMTLGGGARISTHAMGRRTSLMSQGTENAMSQPEMSQLTVESDPLPAKSERIDTVEDAGLRSQLQTMKQRIQELEEEKTTVTLDKAPLESRMKQQEHAWLKEQNRLLQEIESLKLANREANERNRDLELKVEKFEEENKHLAREVQKASSSWHNFADNSNTYNRQVAVDRELAELRDNLRHAEDEIDSMRLAKVSVEKELHATKIELNSLIRAYDELQAEYDEIANYSSNNQEAEIKLQHLTTEHIATSAQLNAACADLAATKARADAAIEAKEAEHKKETEQLQFEMSVLRTRAANVVSEGNHSLTDTEVEDVAVLKARIEERERRIAELEAHVLKGEEQRRQMHNMIQELRGNIRVFVRTRPFLPDDGQVDEPAIDVSPDGESLHILDTRTNAPHDFKFDKVFPASAGQDIVFQEVSDFVQSALDGYQVCLFSYGQTGSGKTHTMQGSGNSVMRGIIPRAVEQILHQAKVLSGQKWDFKLSASFLEIYNEELKDLLVSMSKDRSLIKNPPKLSIKRSREGKSFVDGLTEVKIETRDSEEGMQQLDALMTVAARARSVASTKMNAQSSRSHSVFMLHLRGYNEETGAEVHGALNLCDLAGSERLDRSGANSDAMRLRETQAINKSLSCLGDVFNALAQRASHVPYRNSKLTYLLQDCLSGDGKALMFVNLSPTTASSNESLCSLRFAQRVNQVELGKPTKHIQYTKSKR